MSQARCCAVGQSRCSLRDAVGLAGLGAERSRRGRARRCRAAGPRDGRAASLEQRVRGDALVVHDVAHPPPAALPRIGMIDRGLVVDESLRAAAQLARLDVDRRGDARRRGLEQQPGDVLPPAGVARAAEPVGVERIAVDQPAFFRPAPGARPCSRRPGSPRARSADGRRDRADRRTAG